MPDAIGFGAAGSPALTRRLTDIVRREYRAVGITRALSPQADLATEPRWTRINGTFGSDPRAVERQVEAYVAGLQGGTRGLGPQSAAAVTKHWAGYGAQATAMTATTTTAVTRRSRATSSRSTSSRSRARSRPRRRASCRRTRSSRTSCTRASRAPGRRRVQPYLLQDLLRGQYGFDGVVVSDLGITGNCPAGLPQNRPPASFIGSWGVGMPWGVED